MVLNGLYEGRDLNRNGCLSKDYTCEFSWIATYYLLVFI